MYVEKIYIYSAEAMAGKELQKRVQEIDLVNKENQKLYQPI